MMKMIKFDVTKRDVKFFFLGVLALFIFESLYNWKETKSAFMDGWNGVDRSEKVKTN